MRISDHFCALKYTQILKNVCIQDQENSFSMVISKVKITIENNIHGPVLKLSTHKCNKVCKSVNGNVRHDKDIFSNPPCRNGIRLTIQCSSMR